MPPKPKKTTASTGSRGKRPTTPQAEEDELINMAFDLARQQFRDGTASAQVTTHFLKLGSSREKLEQERLRQDAEFIAAKKQVIAEREKMEVLIEEAIAAMRSYTGHNPPPKEEDEEDFY